MPQSKTLYLNIKALRLDSRTQKIKDAICKRKKEKKMLLKR